MGGRIPRFDQDSVMRVIWSTPTLAELGSGILIGNSESRRRQASSHGLQYMRFAFSKQRPAGSS